MPSPIGRRSALASLASLASLSLGAAGLALPGCRRGSPTRPDRPEPSSGGDDKPLEVTPSGSKLLDWSFEGASSRGGSERATVLVPHGSDDTRYPVLVALHGRGEAVRGAEVGAYAWPRTYRLTAALGALRRGSLTDADLGNMAEPERLAALNRSLAEHPWGGLIVVCPHVPDLTGARSLPGTEAWGKFLLETLMPRVKAECPASDAWGIDGVSMGGRVSMLVGLGSPGAFSAVAAMQPAFQAGEAADLVERSRAFLAKRPKGRIRLLTSDGDYFKAAVGAIDEAMTAAGVAHDTARIKGPHDYSFNEGPGGIEMLLWQERALRGLPSP